MNSLSIAFAAASIAAPLVGGVFAHTPGLGWRWCFLINFPIGAVALLFVLTSRLRTPSLRWKQKLDHMDLISSLILFGSMSSLLIGLTRGGTQFGRWSDPGIAIPLALGSAGLLFYLLFQWIPNNPLAPQPVLDSAFFLRGGRTASIAFLLTFLHGILLYGAVQTLILYFETRDATPLRAAINVLPANVPSTPAAFISGVLMAITGRYKGMVSVDSPL